MTFDEMKQTSILRKNLEQINMNYGKEFKKFATKHQGVNAMYYDKIVAAMNPTNMTPYIIEERQLNISQLDVFSRLMMDRIIFLGTGIDDQIANIVQAQLLFLKVPMLQKIFRFI